MFKVARRAVADVEPIIYNLPATASETYSIGEALKLASGALTKAGAADEVTHICVGEVKDGNVPVIAVLPGTYFETTSTATVAATAIGTAVKLHTDGLTVTATAGGPFVIDETDGATTNSTVVGHFVKPAATVTA